MLLCTVSWLSSPLQDTWQRMEAQVDAGKAKAVGVSNYSVPKLMDLLSYARIKPADVHIEVCWFSDGKGVRA